MSLKRVNFSPLHTFSRATVKNVFQPEPDGFGGTNYILKQVASGAPAFEWDPVTGESLGLSIEESRTNLLTYNRAFDDASWVKLGVGAGSAPVVTANAGVAPDGTVTADRIVFATGGATSSDRSIIRKSVASGTVRRLSFYLKSNTGLTQVISLHNGVASASFLATVTAEWQRFDIQIASDRIWAGLEAEGSLTGSNVDILVWGAQLEVGSNASSPIYTEATTVTRLADVVTVPDLSGWFNASEGEFVCSLILNKSPDAVTILLSLTDGTANNYISLAGTSSGLVRLVSRLSGGSINVGTAVAIPINEVVIIKIKIESGLVSLSVNESAYTTGIPAATLLNSFDIGHRLNLYHIMGTISSIKYYPVAGA